MAQKYCNVAEAAKILGVSPAEINEMVLRRELYGYRDGADWKFKPEDIERVAAERGAGGHEEDSDNVLASEIELGQSDPGLSGTVIGADKNRSPDESDIHLVESDVKLAPDKSSVSDLKIPGSGIELAGPKQPVEAKRGDAGSKVSQFEDLDMTLDHDLTLEDSNVPAPPAKPAAAGDSVVDLSGKKLDDDDLVLGGSGAGSDISIGGDSGISLVDPADSGFSLEAPLNLSPGEESLELGEDDLLGMASDVGTGAAALKGEDDFQLTPMDDLSDADDSESGSQVIALDTEGEGDEAATMVASSGTPVAAMLDEDLGAEPALAAMPLAAATTDLGLANPEDALAMGGFGSAAVALPEAPYTIWNILALVFASMLLILVGMMMYELLRNMWGFEKPVHPGPVDSWLMDTILGWFEK
ncbi:MAG: helix-turn-helix domain-containing protein [Thermoguttaceae bacterium]